jgi:hypothetical protein
MPRTHEPRKQQSSRRAKRWRYFWYLRATEVLPPEHLMGILRQVSYSVECRAAALRSLVGKAPKKLTGGRPYPERRRIVRTHYQV